MDDITSMQEVSTGEICAGCGCELTVCGAPGGGSELTCDCSSYLVA